MGRNWGKRRCWGYIAKFFSSFEGDKNSLYLPSDNLSIPRVSPFLLSLKFFRLFLDPPSKKEKRGKGKNKSVGRIVKYDLAYGRFDQVRRQKFLHAILVLKHAYTSLYKIVWLTMLDMFFRNVLLSSWNIHGALSSPSRRWPLLIPSLESAWENPQQKKTRDVGDEMTSTPKKEVEIFLLIPLSPKILLGSWRK